MFKQINIFKENNFMAEKTCAKEYPMNQSDRVAYVRQLHSNRPLDLPNAWDAASARVIELAGA
ncbi:MAG: hypothetical protein ACREPG_13095, partial [Candidatus Binatia bacterium]